MAETELTKIDARELLAEKAQHLSALLNVIYGGGFEAFNELNDTIKNKYLWACASLSDEVEKLSEQI